MSWNSSPLTSYQIGRLARCCGMFSEMAGFALLPSPVAVWTWSAPDSFLTAAGRVSGTSCGMRPRAETAKAQGAYIAGNNVPVFWRTILCTYKTEKGNEVVQGTRRCCCTGIDNHPQAPAFGRDQPEWHCFATLAFPQAAPDMWPIINCGVIPTLAVGASADWTGNCVVMGARTFTTTATPTTPRPYPSVRRLSCVYQRTWQNVKHRCRGQPTFRWSDAEVAQKSNHDARAPSPESPAPRVRSPTSPCHSAPRGRSRHSSGKPTQQRVGSLR